MINPIPDGAGNYCLQSNFYKTVPNCQNLLFLAKEKLYTVSENEYGPIADIWSKVGVL